MKIFLNPGHDLTYDCGAVNPTNGTTEAEIVARIGSAVASYLERAGYTVEVMQSDNLYYDSSYPDRNNPVTVEAEKFGADLFISLHCNACGSHNARGTETLVYNEESTAGNLARCIQRQIVDSLNTVDRGIKERPDLTVLKHTSMPAVLVELAFIDNNDDCDLLTTNGDEFAKAVARGITDYASKI